MGASRLSEADFRRLVERGLSNSEIARQSGVSEASARGRRKRLGYPASVAKAGVPLNPNPAAPLSDGVDPEVTRARADVGAEGGEFSDVTSEAPITDWGPIFQQFDLDPEVFEIVDDTVRYSMWQQSRRLENGDRDTVELYSYRARFRRKTGPTLTEVELEAFIERARMWRIPSRPVTSTGKPVAAILNLADMQLFKPEGGGLSATLDRLQAALSTFRRHVDEVRARGLNLNELVIVNNGDPFEGIAGNYANQNHTVEGGLRAQMNGVLDVWLMFARELYPLFEKRQFVSVLCNHTQFGRQGGAKDSITGDEDSGSAFLAEALRRILHATPEFEDVAFTIPHDQMNVYTEAAGIKLGFNHGHKIPKSDASGFETWLNGQVRANQRAYDVRLWVTAHRHNLQMFDIGSTSVLQCPSCDGGSKWLTDRTGKHANAGVVSILVGEHHRLGWSDLTFL